MSPHKCTGKYCICSFSFLKGRYLEILIYFYFFCPSLFSHCFKVQPVVLSRCVCAAAPAACKTFFADSSAPTCLPAASVWTTVEEFKPDILWLSGIACPVATPECTASARSFAVNSGCPECADEAEAWNTAYDSCSVATTEAECTVSLPQGGSSSTGATPSTSASPAGGGMVLLSLTSRSVLY